MVVSILMMLIFIRDNQSKHYRSIGANDRVYVCFGNGEYILFRIAQMLARENKLSNTNNMPKPHIYVCYRQLILYYHV